MARVKLDPEREISQLDAEYDPELGQSDPVIRQVCRKLTDNDPELSLAPMDPFPCHAEPGVLECKNINQACSFLRSKKYFHMYTCDERLSSHNGALFFFTSAKNNETNIEQIG